MGFLSAGSIPGPSPSLSICGFFEEWPVFKCSLSSARVAKALLQNWQISRRVSSLVIPCPEKL